MHYTRLMMVFVLAALPGFARAKQHQAKKSQSEELVKPMPRNGHPPQLQGYHRLAIIGNRRDPSHETLHYYRTRWPKTPPAHLDRVLWWGSVDRTEPYRPPWKIPHPK